MSPRGVPMTDVRRRLFDAAESVLTREGPGALSGRAVTREAGCATGLLYNHFPDFDEFLVGFVLDRVRPTAERLALLPGRAGTGTVTENLTAGATSLLEPTPLAVTNLVRARPPLLHRMHEAAREATPELLVGEAAFADYLEAEKALGRVAPGADSEAAGLALVGAVHQLLLSHHADAPDLRNRIERVVAVLAKALLPDQPEAS